MNHATQHVDLPMTLYSYLGIPPDEVLLFGQNILRDDFQGRALNIIQDEAFLLVHDNQYMTFNPKLKSNNLYDYVSFEPKKTTSINNNIDLRNAMLKEIESFIQYYTNGIINNDIFYHFPKSFVLGNK